MATLNSLITGNENPLGTQPANAFNMTTGNFSPLEGLSPQEKGLLEFHRNSLLTGRIGDKSGLPMTVNIKGVSDRRGGLIYNVPGFDPETGKELSDDEAFARAKANGLENYPAFMNGEDANAAAEKLHLIIEDDMRTFTGGR